MAEDDTSARGPIVLRIKLRYDDLDTMVARFAANIGRSGLFLPTKQVQPLGTEIKFELRLADDTPALVGVGRVKHAQPPDPERPKAPFGIAVELMRVTRESRELIMRMIERRRALGLPDVAIPTPGDIEAARRPEPETNPRADTSGIVREAMAQFASAPVSEQILTPGTAPATTTTPAMTPAIGVATMAAMMPAPTAPIVQLSPEPPRAARPRVADVIAKASDGVTASANVHLAELDDARVDVGRVVARARTLAGGGEGLDGELAALREQPAAPLEISIEAASAELAKQLGGVSVARRERDLAARATWKTPPVVVAAAVSDAIAALTSAAVDHEPVAVSAPPVATEAPPVATEAPPVATEAPPTVAEAFQAEPAPVDDEPKVELPDEHPDVELLDSMDLEPVDASEATQVGELPPGPSAYMSRVLAGEAYADDHEALAQSLDAQLAAAEADIDDSEFAGGTAHAVGDAVVDAMAEPQDDEDDDGSEEVSDFDVLAEADAGDADLLGAYGESHADPDAALFARPHLARLSSDDFAARLALDEDDRARDSEDGVLALDPPSGHYTVADFTPDPANELNELDDLAAVPPDDELENALEALDLEIEDVSLLRDSQPHVPLPALPKSRKPDDVPTERPGSSPSRRQPTPGQAIGKAKRATTIDGVLIDFDDDE